MLKKKEKSSIMLPNIFVNNWRRLWKKYSRFLRKRNSLSIVI